MAADSTRGNDETRVGGSAAPWSPSQSDSLTAVALTGCHAALVNLEWRAGGHSRGCGEDFALRRSRLLQHRKG